MRLYRLPSVYLYVSLAVLLIALGASAAFAQAPSTPTGFTATVGDTQLSLSWTASSGATSYNLYRSTTAGGEGTTAYQTGITTTSYTDTGLTDGQQYYYKLVAVNASGASAASAEISAMPNVALTFSNERAWDDGSNLYFTASYTGIYPNFDLYVDTDNNSATGYPFYGIGADYLLRNTYLYQSTANGSWSWATVGSDTLTFPSSGTVQFAVPLSAIGSPTSARMILGCDDAAYHVAHDPHTTTYTASGIPSAPTGLAATQSGSQVNLAWNMSAGATSYNVYRGAVHGGEGTTPYATGITSASYADTGAASGTTYYYTVAAVNSVGTSVQSREATNGPNGPYGGAPWPVPGVVEFENYDTGGEGIAYHDTDAGNKYGKYRSDDVDIETCQDSGGSYDVSSTAPGEWLRYTVNVASAGSYVVALRVASNNPGTRLHIEDANGTNLTGAIIVPNTGGWQTWTTITAPLTLPAGVQTLRVVEDVAAYNLNYMNFAVNTGTAPNAPDGLTVTAGNGTASLTWNPVPGAPTYNIMRSTVSGAETLHDTVIARTNYTDNGLMNGTTYYYTIVATNSYGSSPSSAEASATPSGPVEAPYGGTPWPIPGTVELENFDTGGEEVGYHDTDPTNDGGQYRTSEGVDIWASANASNGYLVGGTSAGEWMRYTVNVRQAGQYTVTCHVASGGTYGGAFHLEDQNGSNLSGSIAVPDTGGYDTWTNVLMEMEREELKRELDKEGPGR
jgi:hypothetical protein